MADMKQEIREVSNYFEAGKVKVNINSETKAPVLYKNGTTITGLSAILQYLSQKGTTRQKPQNLEDNANIRQWLEYRVTEIDRCENEKEIKLVLKELNLYLSNLTYFVGNCLSIADICIYYGLHSIVNCLTYQEKEKFNHVSRWFNFIQYQVQDNCNLPNVPFQSQALYFVA